jgi:surface protein
MTSFPAGISSMKLKVSTFEQVIASASLGGNSIKIAEQNILSALQSDVTINPSIVVTYDNTAFPSSNIVVAGTPYVPPPKLILLANGVTIKYDANPADVPTSTAKFIHADPRGTGMEWFAVVKNGMKTAINLYARNYSSGPFIPPGQSSPVPLNNIVTTLMTDMSSMCNFSDADWWAKHVFNHPINSWDTSNVTNMQAMFHQANAFNQPLNSWNTSNVTNMSKMFESAVAFNQPINIWDTSKVTNMSNMFNNAVAFNQPLNSWNTSNVTDMQTMFYQASVFNQPINSWDTSKVTNMYYMFTHAFMFNQPLNSWNTSNVANMNGMFMEAYVFNQPLNLWNTSKVTTMDGMFYRATSFNQNISGWNVSLVTIYSNFRYESALTTNYTPPAFR